MLAPNLLIPRFASCLGLCVLAMAAASCTRRGVDVEKTPNLTEDARKAALLKEQIPLDALGERQSLVLREVRKDEDVGTTFPGMQGLEKQFAFVPDEAQINEATKAAPIEQFPGFAIVSELSPQGAREDATRRVYNLPELLERLALEGPNRVTGVRAGGLPPGVQVFPSSDTSLSVVISSPTVLAASFSTNRFLRILNRSKLVLIAPMIENVVIQQETPLSGEKPTTQVHSYTCPGVDTRNLEGTVQLLRLDEVILGTRESCATITDSVGGPILAPAPSKLKLEPWMPQVLLTQRMRKETIVQAVKRWSGIYTFKSVQFRP